MTRKGAPIRFIRHYQMYREDFYDVIYTSGRCCEYSCEYRWLPATVRRWLENESRPPVKQYDKTLQRDEYIYKPIKA